MSTHVFPSHASSLYFVRKETSDTSVFFVSQEDLFLEIPVCFSPVSRFFFRFLLMRESLLEKENETKGRENLSFLCCKSLRRKETPREMKSRSSSLSYEGIISLPSFDCPVLGVHFSQRLVIFLFPSLVLQVRSKSKTNTNFKEKERESIFFQDIVDVFEGETYLAYFFIFFRQAKMNFLWSWWRR